MNSSFKLACVIISMFIFISCTAQTKKMEKKEYNISKTEAEWKDELSKEQYHILIDKGTEIAFTGKYWENYEDGVYHCAACNTALFNAETKFKSGSGWPSFWKPIDDNNVKIVVDKSLGMLREEVVCGNCGGHLGHVFNDGPKPTGLRYCLNSASLDFDEKDK